MDEDKDDQVDLKNSIIISFLNPYIFPAEVLEEAIAAYNIHPAPPAYPGRDPQHFSIYDGYLSAGATLHRMDASVDSGEILDVLERPLQPDDGPIEHDQLSRQLSKEIFERNLEEILDNTIAPRRKWNWSTQNKHRRSDFIRMSYITTDLSDSEIERRIRAFHVPGYRNKVHVKVGDRYFIYDPEFDARMRKKKKI